ncbi:hypothetical protein Q0Z83_076540 [Actinoplanes sichuanensis]|nr:hypothetical protein Q0Z83_076540 [Actinoplanes sichuanensis]
MRAALIYQHAPADHEGHETGEAGEGRGKRAKRSKPTDGGAGGAEPGTRRRDGSPDA